MSYDTIVNGVSLRVLKDNILKNGYSPSNGTVLDLIDKLAALEADAARFRSLQWRFDAERDSGPGGRWTATVHTDNPAIRNNLINVIDATMKGGV